MSARTKRKNLQKRKKRRLFATIAAEIKANEEAQWTLDKEELDLMRNEEERQRTHEQWKKAVEKTMATAIARQRILEQRQELILSLRLQLQQTSER
ncbi:unnamed protein product [Hyaloperonospora brassicae]|uniref:Uncharacterized protein n=1 Tax=Hyaloperonospora brassicae TaxID=162125 RepID=A0AAV0UR85_HYABA|nr:unnamed protein product [Hyaloperonospora brassicae]